MKIVETGYKIDFHIHSIFSNKKDKGKVAFNTLENISVLVDKLTENSVQICAITDHDVFNYDLYRELKKYEDNKNSSIVKVFPGIEFSVEFVSEKATSVIHVIAIFNDENDEKVRNIPKALFNEEGKIDYNREQAFSESKFLEILRKIDLDTILIAHQKSTLTSKHYYKNDVKNVGEKRFNEILFTDYFEAFEFKNRNNEVFNRSYINSNNLNENIRFITGSDCHDWRFYPCSGKNENLNFEFTYMKCLPTFRGIVMAITDYRRIKTVNSFFSIKNVRNKDLEIVINKKKYKIPLSKGINVIIGDNSIGKSLLLHKITKFKKQHDGLLDNSIVRGYKKYLNDNNIEIKTEFSDNEIFEFDMQGEIRDKFEKGLLNSNEFFDKYYPTKISIDVYLEKINRQLSKIYKYLKDKFALEKLKNSLNSFIVFNKDIDEAESITFVGSIEKDKSKANDYNSIVGELRNIVEIMKTIKEIDNIEKEDVKELDNIITKITNLIKKYKEKNRIVNLSNNKIAIFISAIEEFKQKYNNTMSDLQKEMTDYNANIDNAANTIATILYKKKNNIVPIINIEKEDIKIQTEKVHNYNFNSKVKINEISSEYIIMLFSDLMKKTCRRSIFEMSSDELSKGLLNYSSGPQNVLNEIKERVDKRLQEDFSNVFTITQDGIDRTSVLSEGFNSKIYFDIISYEDRKTGTYIIDQPEDSVSQKAIREYLLDRFKVMGQNRQVIIVTHNPQFIVNLDVDNVIYIGKENDEIVIKSGALEYKDDEYDILDIITENIEGGLDTLRRRWKRYEKGISI